MFVKRMRALLGVGLVGVMLAGACAGGGGTNECEDGLDNDGDGRIDDSDPGCPLNGNRESPDPLLPACNDGVDNDGDGYTDWPQDPGCKNDADFDEYNEPVPECRDGIDNDGDGLVDYPNDPGCRLDLENSEGDDCPGGPFCPKCSNGIDDDGDGAADYPEDPGCDRAADNDEFNADPGICGANVQVLPLPSTGEVMGTIQAGDTNELISQGCGGSGHEHVYTYTLPERANLSINTNHPETTLDTVVYIRSACRDISTELGCDDDAFGFKSELSIDAPAGMYFIIVDAHNTGSAGDYKLTVNTFIPRGEPCVVGVDTCAPGLVCRKLTDTATGTTCEKPECSDGLNNDGDSTTDFPNDPGCTDENDNDESDDCPTGPNCPECGNGADDDDDGKVDYAGGDPGCQSAADTGEIDDCVPGVSVQALDPNGVSGTTAGSSNFTGTCGFGTAPEDIWSYKLDRDDLNSITFSTLGSTLDTVTYVRFDDCSASSAQIACEDPGSGGEDVSVSSPMAGTYFVFVDGDFGAGNYVLEARGEIPGFGACDPSDTQFVCELGYFCDVDTCTPAACNDGNDNEGDGKTDYPNDPGCDSPSDPTEEDNCPGGVGCPLCSNGMDDDGDGKADYPLDPGCNAASDNDETDCPGETDGVDVLTLATTTGSTTGLTNDFVPSCSTTSTAPEKAFILPVSGKLASLRIDTIGSTLDTVLYIKPSECSQPDIGCNDEGDGPFGSSTIELTDLDAGSYIIFVDGWSGGAGDFTLNVKGVIKKDEACDAAQVAAGMMECEAGYACGTGGTCVTAACNNGVDDGDAEDTLADYPNDPGCDSPSDNDESDTCPSDPTGPGCPACSNGLDDDGDGIIDWSATAGGDPGCLAASDNNEIDECIAGVAVTLLDNAGATGTTPSGTTSNFVGSCHTSTTSTEEVYAYNVDRALASITFSTVGSTGDTVTYVRFGDCDDTMTEVGCANVQNAGEDILVPTPTQGWYYIFVDGDFISNISYVLNVSGTIANGQACTPADTQFVCEAGHVCGASNLCEPTLCNDGIDNDGDLKADALDPGCDSIDDNTEDPDPSPLPQCADGMDNDGDGDADYPADTGCENAADDMELNCDDMDPIGTITAPITTGSTTGTSDDFTPSCQSNSAAGDLVWILNVPGDLANLDLDTIGSSFDTVMMIKQNLCSNADYGCDDDYPAGIGPSEILLSTVPAGLYFVIVDGYSSNTGTVTLNVSGTIVAGQPCDAAQVASGLFTCATGTSCQDPGSGFVCQ